jgi:hypothetical protein
MVFWSRSTGTSWLRGDILGSFFTDRANAQHLNPAGKDEDEAPDRSILCCCVVVVVFTDVCPGSLSADTN